MKIHNLFGFICLAGCAAKGPHELPDAHLVVDGDRHRLGSTTSCWDYGDADICADGPPVTALNPVPVRADSEVTIEFVSGSHFKHGYYIFYPVRFYNDARGTEIPDSVLWEVKEGYRDEFIAYDRAQRQKLEDDDEESIQFDVPSGKYIFEAGTWWDHGDVFHTLYVEIGRSCQKIEAHGRCHDAK